MSPIVANNKIIQNTMSHRMVNSLYEITDYQQLLRKENILNKQNDEKSKLNKIFTTLFNNNDFESLEKIIPLMNLSKEEKEKIEKIVNMYKNWDLFNYDEMTGHTFDEFPTILKPIEEQYTTNIKAIKKIKSKHKEYRLLIDLINNSSRRNREGKNNEAILELYRAMELITHIRLLKNYKIDTTDVDLNRLEELCLDESYILYLGGFSNKYNIISLTLKEHFYLLKEFNDPIGTFFKQHNGILHELIKMRHSSLLIHGTTNVTTVQYKEFEYLIKQMACKLNKNIKKYLKETEFPRL